MITVLKVNKQGNRILGYTCTDGKNTKDISKEQLIQYMILIYIRIFLHLLKIILIYQLI